MKLSFYTTMSRLDQEDMNSEMIFGITAKKQNSGEVIYFDYNISTNYILVNQLTDLCNNNQPTELEFQKLIKIHMNNKDVCLQG